MFNLFGKRKVKSPATHDDCIWVENNLLWLDKKILDVAKQPTFLPTKTYFNWDFRGDKADAEYLLDTICDMFGVNSSHIKLNYFDQSTQYFGGGMGTQIEKGEDTAAGYYVFDDGRHEILIELGQLKNTSSLIATIAHELSHYVLIGLHEIGYNDDQENEFLTDLLAIAYGFGIFLGNSAGYHRTIQTGDGYTATQIGKQGYLPAQVIGYAMGIIQLHKGKIAPTPDWVSYMQPDLKKNFQKSLAYIAENQEEICKRGNSDNLFVW